MNFIYFTLHSITVKFLAKTFDSISENVNDTIR